MNLTLNRVKEWSRQTPQLSRWPGSAVRTPKGEPDFHFGRVVKVTEISVHVETKLRGIVKLMGDAYPHVCDKCQNTVPGNVTFRRPAEVRHFCMYCGPEYLLRMLKVGEKVRVHHRFGSGAGPQSLIQVDNAWGSWYGEKWDW
jgi:hypothetical protein